MDMCSSKEPITLASLRPVMRGANEEHYHSGMANPGPIEDVPIGGDMIRLGQFMKFAGLLDSGGDVKEAIIDGYVLVNGEVDRRRGRQLQVGDVVGFEGRQARVCP